jgi:hypothetical protein
LSVLVRPKCGQATKSARSSANTLYDLTQWTGQAGDAAAARDQLAALLSAMERVLGPEHPDTKLAAAGHAAWDLFARRGI